MAVIRLILLVAVLGILSLLLVQNWSPVLALVFLGVRTLPLPLAMWIFFSTAAGALTSLLITTLLKVSNYFGEPQRQRPNKSAGTSPRAKATSREEPQPQTYRPSTAASTKESDTSHEFDDWETNDPRNDDWDFDQQQREAPTPIPQTPPVRDSQSYERQQEPQSRSQSGSVYSYNYREPKNTAVGKTESVYDADYRVIIPPSEPPTTNQVDEQADDDDDDWKFFEDDNFENEDEPPRK
ncbi:MULTISPECIES: LapA family protein [unclassified Nodularia (in: cyanobacteria)]|uniref:LapA family protein n=1 Tax=unclassified Nodularia (in: cyanobacteria) TaxID=2656917 RepID=UPI0018822794|nr:MULTISPECIES: LapA family protein [unclassified Nodularia (in: cyanobacteria)]MBE9198240.1 LapA family protein [Nodularia sp. LEGE 06071]MCC2694526.1 LapA family protein [Nodularia sp. LEGE 04288]